MVSNNAPSKPPIGIENATMTGLKPDNVLRLRDDRLLGYGEFGDPQGTPLFFFHGFPGSRLEARLGEKAAAQAHVRMIAPDRPGMGLSEFKKNRALLDWPADVVELADALGIGRFAVAGVSGGGPYAAACAFKIPDRLSAVGIISGVGPFDTAVALEQMSRQNRLLFGLARKAPWSMLIVEWLMAQGARRFAKQVVSMMTRAMPECDRALALRPDILSIMIEDAAEAFRSGATGAAWEAVLYARPWGFQLRDIRVPVHLWQGDLDTNVPVSMGHYQADLIPDCHATFYPGEGHLCLLNHLPEMLADLTKVSV
jgi:pimeloyl-ACP methyl ester carboxylesterase